MTLWGCVLKRRSGIEMDETIQMVVNWLESGKETMEIPEGSSNLNKQKDFLLSIER
jgi:hypothetical protein